MAVQQALPNRCRVALLHLDHLRRFFPELAGNADGDLLAFPGRERMAGVTVDAGEGFVVDLHLQGLFGLLFGGGFGDGAQVLFPIVEFGPT